MGNSPDPTSYGRMTESEFTSHGDGPGAIALNPIAFLVDGENVSAASIQEMLAEASKYGSVVIRRVYGDWSSTHMSGWKKIHQEHALIPIQQFPNVSGKNATDSAMIIDAMDILHSDVVRGFCIVSSDSDYTRLATRLREAGLFVMGVGEAKTPDAFRRACHIFVLIENLKSEGGFSTATGPGKKGSALKGRQSVTDALDILDSAFENVVRDDGLAHMAELGEALRRLDPAFDTRTYGKFKLVDLINALPEVFVVERKEEFGPGAVYVRRKQDDASEG